MSTHSGSSANFATPNRVSTSSLRLDEYRILAHPLNPQCVRQTISLGDRCGMSKQGVHLSRVKPNTTSTLLHWHSMGEEWIYILEAGDAGATLILQRGGDTDPTEEKVYKGDFLGFPAGPNAHALRAGDDELVYLVGGTREQVDVCTYPSVDKRLVLDSARSGMWIVDEEQVKSL